MRLLSIPILLLTIAAGDAAPFQVDHPWARPSVGAGKIGAAYLTITDRGPADRLTGLSSPVADRVELHESAVDNGVTRMRPVPVLSLEPGQTITMAPGGYHIMLMGLTSQLKAGDSFPLTLRFEHAAPLTVTVTVEARGGGQDHMHR